MNERIKELAEQAGYNSVWSTKADKEEHFDLEKFAELIVRKCADVLLEWKKEPFPLDPNFAANLIKEHFGVEE
jgi:hypothetical protein